MKHQPVIRRKRGWMRLTVAKITDENSYTKTFFLVDSQTKQREVDFIAGQYLTFRFEELSQAEPPVRSYTISSCPEAADYIAVTIKRADPGLVSQYLFETLREGDCLTCRGPIGDFIYNESSLDHLYMIGAGCGVVPFLSIGEHFAPLLGRPKAPRKMTLLISFASQADAIGLARLRAMANYQGVDLHITLSREDRVTEGYLKGRLDESMMSSAMAGLYSGTTFMLCGPEDFMRATKKHLLGHKVDPDQIRTESFF